MKNNFFGLLKTISAGCLKNVPIILLSVLTILINLITGIVIVYYANVYWEAYVSWFSIISNALVSIFLAISVVYFATKLLSDDKNNGIISLEKRFGFNNKSIYFTRIFILYAYLSFLLGTILVLNGVFYAAVPQKEIYYQVFIAKLGWYFIFALMMATFSVVFNLLIANSLSSVISISISFLTLFFILSFSQLVPEGKVNIKNEEYYDFETIELGSQIYKVTEINKVFEQSDLAKKIVSQGKEVEENLISEMDFDRVDGFLFGPALWFDGNKNGFQILDDYPEYEDYNNLINYFHNLFEKSYNVKIQYSDLYEFNYGTEKFEPNQLIKFLKNNNKKPEYLFINDLMEVYFTNFYLQNSSIKWTSYWRMGDYGSQIKEGYHSAAELLFFKALNHSIQIQQTEFKKIEVDIMNQIYSKNRMQNLFNPLMQLTNMWYGRMYCDDVYYDYFYRQYEPVNSKIDFKVKSKINPQTQKTEYYFVKNPILEFTYIFYTLLFFGTNLIFFFYFNKKSNV
ncbi:hypothetical protein SSABA_v1c09060 [Spiroplasma sabaudiense Ar-1343]|uniref:Uncharacterized protein n=1 Tax=Spiroplasma sabaudiense Ar-1343 TaxID=1276257 RepID=W6ABT8_9MOLU|nr:ABC transporter permease [Spiroplasma sabaudiense]AHI54305.1 hypothetical protein SSABA_v1c09060 [Spiroplasma sabaudiense Ar-1343]